jgi:hypothetical protein
MSNNEIEKQMSILSIQNRSKKDERDQPLKRSTYNINEAFDNVIANNSNLLYDSSSIHPLQKTNDFNQDQSAYALDLHPNFIPPNSRQQQQPIHRDLNVMMKDLTLSSNLGVTNNTITAQQNHKSSMPYCV